MRKLLCSLLVVVMVLSLAGCSSKNEESVAAGSEKTVLTFGGTRRNPGTNHMRQLQNSL